MVEAMRVMIQCRRAAEVLIGLFVRELEDWVLRDVARRGASTRHEWRHLMLLIS